MLVLKSSYFSVGKAVSLMPVRLENLLFRSTSKSRPNNIRGEKNVRPYVRTSVRPSVRRQKVSSISMKFGIQVQWDLASDH